MSEKRDSTALVVLSGGQDSTTCLYWALERYKKVETITFDYGQRHKIEIDCAKTIAEKAKVSYHLITIDSFRQLGGNSLTDDIPVNNSLTTVSGLPNTFVPGRNLIFLTFAAAYAYNRGIDNIVTGVCETDFSGYPDCRNETMIALEQSLNLGMDAKFEIQTPLMWLSKAETILLMKDLEAISALKDSHTCYNGQFPPCSKCPACVLRAKGFSEANIKDPIFDRSI